MTTSLLRKLNFTKNDIPQTQFSSYLSLHRMKNIRNLMRQKQCDAFLIILGVDSKFNCGSMQAASYLLFDLFETRESDMIRSNFDMEIFEDLIICIQQNETHVYCNAVNYSLLLPYISHWPNLRIHYVNEAEMSNLDKYEEHKMTAFRWITTDCKCIAIAYTDQHGNAPAEFTKMLIEEWPIVQSFAFDTATQSSREFFTLSREVINLAREVQQLALRPDPVSIETVLIRSLLAFTGSLEAVFRLVDAYVESKDQSNKVKLLEPLMSMYLHPTNKETNSLFPPYFLFGKDASKQNILSNSTQQKYFDNSESVQASHAIVRGCVQSNGLICERTCFFQPPKLSAPEEISEEQHTSKLICIYMKLLKVMWEFIEEVQNESIPLETILLKAQESLKFGMRHYKHGGAELKLHCPPSSNSQAVFLAVLSGAVYDIIDKDSVFLGSVVAADTLIISTIRMNRTLISREVINLTDCINHIHLWMRSTVPIKPKEFIQKQDKVLFDEKMDLVTNSTNNPGLITANCAWSENCIVVYGKRVGITRLTPSKILHYRPIDVDRPELLELILPGSVESLLEYIAAPIQLTLNEKMIDIHEKETTQTTDSEDSDTQKKACGSIWILLKPRSRPKRLFLEQVAPIWRSRGILQQTEHLPPSHVMRASLVATYQTHDVLSSLSDLKSSVIDASGYPKQFSISQLITQQLSDEAWLRIHRGEMLHIEAACCLDTVTLGVTSIVEYVLRCGLAYPRQEKWQSVDSIDWVNILRKILEHVSVDLEGRSAWLRAVEPIAKDDIVNNADINGQQYPLTLGGSANQCTPSRGPFVITVICGPIGSRKEVVMRNLINMVKEETRWITMQPTSANDLSTVLKTGLEEWAKQDTKNSEGQTVRVRGLLLCPGVCGAREVLSVLTKLHREDGQSIRIPPIRIGCVVTCVDVRCALMDNGRYTFPGVLELVAEGWTNYLLHTGPLKSKQVAATKFGVQMEEVERLLRSVNPRLGQLHAPDGDTGHGHVLEALLDDSAFDESTLQRARLLSYPNLILLPCEPRLQSITLRFARPLDRCRFTRSLKSIFNALKPWPFHGNIYAIQGQVSFISENQNLFEVYHNTLTGISRISSTKPQKDEIQSSDCRPYWLTGTLAASQNNEKEDDATVINLFANWIRSTGPQQESPKPSLTLSDLTSKDLEKIQEKYHLSPLPPGWYYTGVYYVNMNGEKSFQHPNIDDFIAEYLEGENNKIAARNARISRHPVPDLFNEPS